MVNQFKDVKVTGVVIKDLSLGQQAVLTQQARLCQAMVDADIHTLEQIISADKQFVHMSGKKQSRDAYSHDIQTRQLDYHAITIANPVIIINNDNASINYTSVLTATAYGINGTFSIQGTHWFQWINNQWININQPEK